MISTRMAEGGAVISWLVLAQSVPVPGDGLMELAARFGIPVAGLVFFVWWAWKRDGELSKRMREIEDNRVELLKTTVERCTEAIANNTRALDQFVRNQAQAEQKE